MSSWPFSVPPLRKVWAVPRGTKTQAPSVAFEMVPATLIRKVPFTIQKHSSKLVCTCSGGPAAGGTTSNQVSATPLVVSPVVFLQLTLIDQARDGGEQLSRLAQLSVEERGPHT